MASAFRFDPPRFELGPELSWILTRAFGPAGGAPDTGDALDLNRVIELAVSLDLMARIGAVAPQPTLQGALGKDAAARILEAHRQMAARSLVVEKLGQSVAGAGRELDIPVIFLKGTALLFADRLPTGARGMTDIDVLTRGRDAPRLQQWLKEMGWVETPGPSGEHQLQMLTHRSGVGLEVHTIILGVRVAGSGSASAGDLVAEGLCVPLPGRLEGGSVPVDSLLLAHLLVHGIAQHGLKPSPYPMTRLIADAQDLCADRDRWDELLPEAMGWIGSDVSREEAKAVRDLALRLGGGEDPATIIGADDHPARLLRHILAGVLDVGYRNGLRLRSLASPVAARSASRTLIRNTFHTVWLARPQVEVLYGTPRTAIGYWGWRLWRPFDLVLRAVRYGAAWVADRRRR